MKRTTLRVVVILSLVAMAIPAAATPASAKKKPQFSTTPDNYLPATVGGLTVILRGGTCPPATFNAIDAMLKGSAGDALAVGGVCIVLEAGPGVIQFPALRVLSPAELASEQASVAADTAITKSPVATEKNVSGVKVEIDQYTRTLTEGPSAGQTSTWFHAFGTPVKGKIVTSAIAPDEATALAELQTMLQAAQGKVPRLVTTPPSATRNTPQDPNDPDAFFKALPGIEYGHPYDSSKRQQLNVLAGRIATQSATGEEAAVNILTCATAIQPCAVTTSAFTPGTVAGQPVYTFTLIAAAGALWWPAPLAVEIVGVSREFVTELMALLIQANTKDKPKATHKP